MLTPSTPPELLALYWPERADQTAIGEPTAETVHSERGRGARHTRRRRTHQRRPSPPELVQLARDSYLKLGGSVANAVFGFAFVVVATRGLGRAGAGALFESLALFFIADNLGELGADTGLVRMIPRYRALGRTHDIRRTIKVALIPVVVIGAVLATVLYVAAPALSHLLSHQGRSDQIVTYVRIFAFFLPLSSLSTVALSGTRGFDTMLPFVAVDNVGKPGIRPVLLALALAAGLGATGIALSWALPIVAGLAVALLWLFKLLHRAERTDGYDGTHRRHIGDLAPEFWRFSSPRALAGFFATAGAWLDTLLLGGLRSVSQAGVYTAAGRYMTIGLSALQAMILVISPQIAAALATRDRRRAEALYQTATWWLMALTWPVYLVLAIYAPLFLSIFGRDFREAHTALAIMSLSVLVNLATGPVSAVLMMGGYSVWNLIDNVAALAVNIGLNVALIPRYGINGAAIAFAATMVVNNLVPMIQVRAFLGLAPVGKGFAVVAVASTACFGALGLVARSVLGSSPSGFLVFALAASVLYFGILYRFRRVLQLSVLREAAQRSGASGRARLPRARHAR